MKKLVKSIFGAAFYVFLATSTSICNKEPEHSNEPAGQIEFVGRSMDVHASFTNDRLIILYLNGKEIGRDITRTGEYYIDNKPNDGFFRIIINNDYKITEKEIAEMGYSTGEIGTLTRAKEMLYGSATFVNVGAQLEGNDAEFHIPSRNNLKYTVKVFQGELGTISREIRECDYTVISETGEVICPFGNNESSVQNSNVRLDKELEITKFKDDEDLIIDNCNGYNSINQRYQSSEKFVHEFNFSLGITTLAPSILSKIQAKIGITDKREYSKNVDYDLIAKPRTKVIYTIKWYKVWQNGTVEYKTEKETKSIPFKALKDLKYEISAKNYSCN